MNTRALYIPGPCQRPGCEKTDSIKVRIDSELFAADPERGVEAGCRRHGLGYCGGQLLRVTEPYMVAVETPRGKTHR